MELTITAVGPDNRGLADPIIHYATGQGANIAEIQMYDHDEEALFAMMMRIHLAGGDLTGFREALEGIGQKKGLAVRVWGGEQKGGRARLAICVTQRPEPALALLRAIRDQQVAADPVVMIGNREACRGIAEQFDVDWHNIGDREGRPNTEEMARLFDRYRIDYIVLARYMRILPASICWGFAGGRIINLHHGLLPSFPGLRPYHDAYAVRMLTFGCTCHFIVPELDGGNQIIHQSTFTVQPGTKLEEIIRVGQSDNEPRCLVEGVRRVVNREVRLHFHRVVRGAEGEMGDGR